MFVTATIESRPNIKVYSVAENKTVDGVEEAAAKKRAEQASSNDSSSANPGSLAGASAFLTDSSSSKLKRSSGTRNVLGDKKKSQEVADFGGSVAIAVGRYTNNTDATINDLASVDAPGKVTVCADTLNVIDVDKLYGVNLISPFLDANREPDYRYESDGVDQFVNIKKNETVDVGGIGGAGALPHDRSADR